MKLFNRVFLSTKRIVTHPQFKPGTAFFTFLFFAWMGLREFAQIRYDIKARHGVNLEMEKELEKQNIKKKPDKSIETLYYEMVEDNDLDDWYNIRGPRIGEDSKTIQDEQREKHNQNVLKKQ